MSAAAAMADASSIRDASDWNRTAPPQLAGRYEDVMNAAIALAYASRPGDLHCGAVSYWRTLPVAAQNVHTLRAIHAVAEALRIAVR